MPLRDTPTVVMGHGGGGAMSGELIEHLFLPAFGVGRVAELGDSAVLAGRRRPAGVLDRLVRGEADVLPRRLDRRPGRQRHGQRPGHVAARRRCTCRPRSSSRRAPRWPTSAGSPTAMGAAAQAAGVRLVTGDTKVVDSGSGDGVYVNTAGVGRGPRRRRHRPAPGRGRRRGARQRRHRRARGRGDELPRGPGVRHHRRAATPRRCTAWSPPCSPPASTCTCCATRPGAGSPRR